MNELKTVSAKIFIQVHDLVFIINFKSTTIKIEVYKTKLKNQMSTVWPSIFEVKFDTEYIISRNIEVPTNTL